MSMRTDLRLRVPFATVALVATLFQAPSTGAQTSEREEFTAFAVNMGTAFGVRGGGGQSATLQITIERWSTPAERQALVKAFTERGPDGLLHALQNSPRMGFIRTLNSLGWELRYTRQVPDDEGGRRILIATDRPIGFEEARNQPRTIDYPFTLIEMRLNKDNKGEGKLAVATKIALSRDKQHIELENYGSEPVRLTSIERR